jgi:hypothetical protein
MRKLMTAAAFTLLVFVGNRGGATQILPMTAEELSKNAELVFVGTCLSREFRPGNIPATEYTFKIENAVKGGLQTGTLITFRQWGGAPTATRPDIPAPRLVGMPVYEPGQSYTLFLGAESQAGLRFPVGGGQGVFRVTKSGGSTSVKNELDNRFLYPSAAAAKNAAGKSVRPAGPAGGEVNLNDLIQTVRKTGGQQ